MSDTKKQLKRNIKRIIDIADTASRDDIYLECMKLNHSYRGGVWLYIDFCVLQKRSYVFLGYDKDGNPCEAKNVDDLVEYITRDK